jgi:hypothetical protein
MTRSALFSAGALLCTLALAPVAFAQTAKATPATATTGTTAPAAKAKFVPLVKGVASIEVIQGPSKTVGKDIVTVLKIKNVSSGSIGMLRVDELWYNKDLKHVSGDSQPIRRAILPGEIVEVTLKSPTAPNLYRSQYSFSHANGTITAKSVKKFAE